MTPATFEHFDEVSEHEETALHGTATPIWRIITLLLLGTIALLVCAGVICAHHGLPPTLFNMLSENTPAGPFAVTAINALQAAHFIVATALYYRVWRKSITLARVQLGLAVATHGSLLLVLFLLPFLGWSQDWASPITVLVWAAWELAALLALRRVYQFRLPRERRYLKLSWVAFAVFLVGAIAYVVLRMLPGRPHVALLLLLSECLMGLAVLAFMALLLLHTKRVYFTMHVEAGVLLYGPSSGSGNDGNQYERPK
jgi:hypothetical protein